MMYRAPIGSQERHRFLEQAQTTLLENLETSPVINALGGLVVQRVHQANDLLVAPNLRGNKLVMPQSYIESDNVPFVAIRNGETVELDAAVILPTPTQIKQIRTLLKEWRAEEDEVSLEGAEDRLMKTMARKIPQPTSIELPKHANGCIIPYAVGAYKADVGLSRAPEGFYLQGRPALGLFYSRSYKSHVVLLHELLHLDQYLATPTLSGNDRERLTDVYRKELEAHHYAANYARAVYIEKPLANNRLLASWQSAWRQSEAGSFTQVEEIRQKFADPAQPFEPNAKMTEELRKAGFGGTFSDKVAG